MKQYIDKAALAANIEARYNECLKRAKIIDAEYWNGKADAYRDMLVVLDALEAKDVDLDFIKEVDMWVRDNGDTNGFFNVQNLAKYFFELGLKAQKGE